MRALYKCVFLSLILALCGIGCSDDIQHPDEINPGADSILLSYSVNDLDTRGENTLVAESEIGHAYLLFFSGTGDFVSSSYAVNDTKNPGCLKFDIPDQLEENTPYSIVALANADCYVPEKFNNYQAYLDSFAEDPLTIGDNRLLLHSSSPVTQQSVSLLPMKASSDFSFSITSSGFKITGNLNFERLVSRIDISNAVTSGFEIQKVGLCNWRNSYAPLVAGKNIAGEIKGILSHEDESITFIDYPSANDSGTTGLAPAFYCFPSSSETPQSGDETTTALILKAKYGSDEGPTYYRINIEDGNGSSELKQNYCYHISINSVKASGKPTAKEAYESKEQTPIEGPEIYIESIPNTADASHIVSIDQPTATTPGKIIIDGFAHEVFNSFLDIPFAIKGNTTSASDVTISSTLVWPLEGTISHETLRNNYYYCPESFTNKSVVNTSNEIESPTPFTLSEDLTFYISVGAMAPDDPAIKRSITIATKDNSVTYDIEIRPRPVIINDVIITDSNGGINLITDRNYQVYETFGCTSYDENITTSWNTDGTKKQAYHYSSYAPMKIPFKTSYDTSADESLANETYHSEMLGFKTAFSNRSQFQTKNGQWKRINQCDLDNCQSPFYTATEINSWKHITTKFLRDIAGMMKVSKMRMFLVSEVPAKDGNSEIPVCCYFPYFNKDSSSMTDKKTSKNSGVFFATIEYSFLSSTTPGLCRVIRCNNTGVEFIEPSSTTGLEGCVRPIRELTQTELDNYRDNYLGYKAGIKLKFSPCIPDTRP